MANYFSFSDPLNSGVDFYTADDFILINAQLSIESNLVVVARKIVLSSSQISGSVNAAIISSKISHASSSISGILDCSLSAIFERQDALVVISGTASVVVNITKNSHLISNMSASATMTGGVKKIALSSSSLNAEASLSISSTRIRLIQSNVSGSVGSLIVSRKIAHATSQISGLLNVSLIAVFERQDASINISGEVSVSVNMKKIAHGQVSPAISATGGGMTVGLTKISLAQSAISGNINASNTLIRKTSFASSNLLSSVNALPFITKISFIMASFTSTVTLSTAGRIFLATIRINILNNTNITVKPIRFSANIVSDNTLIRSLLLLDNKALTNQTRNLTVSATPKFIENTNWQGDISRYYKNSANNKGSKRTFNVDWSFIPNKSALTVDFQESRDFLNNIAQDSDVHELTIINQDINGVTPYTEESVDVFITNYSETLIRRDLLNQSYYFSCSMVLEEA